MRAYRVSKESNLSLEEKIEEVNGMDVSGLLYVIREWEESPREYQKEVIEHVAKRVSEFGIVLM